MSNNDSAPSLPTINQPAAARQSRSKAGCLLLLILLPALFGLGLAGGWLTHSIWNRNAGFESRARISITPRMHTFQTFPSLQGLLHRRHDFSMTTAEFFTRIQEKYDLDSNFETFRSMSSEQIVEYIQSHVKIEPAENSNQVYDISCISADVDESKIIVNLLIAQYQYELQNFSQDLMNFELLQKKKRFDQLVKQIESKQANLLKQRKRYQHESNKELLLSIVPQVDGQIISTQNRLELLSRKLRQIEKWIANYSALEVAWALISNGALQSIFPDDVDLKGLKKRMADMAETYNKPDKREPLGDSICKITERFQEILNGEITDAELQAIATLFFHVNFVADQIEPLRSKLKFLITQYQKIKTDLVQLRENERIINELQRDLDQHQELLNEPLKEIVRIEPRAIDEFTKVNREAFVFEILDPPRPGKKYAPPIMPYLLIGGLAGCFLAFAIAAMNGFRKCC